MAWELIPTRRISYTIVHGYLLTISSILYIGKVARQLLDGSDLLDPIAGSIIYVLGVSISMLMWSFGLIWLVFAFATVIYSSPFPFNMGWWGFTFPLGVYAANTMELGKVLDLMFFKVFGTVCTFHYIDFTSHV